MLHSFNLGPLAQSVRAPGCQPGGRQFKPGTGRVFECTKCDRRFDSPTQLGGHVGSHNRGEEYRARRRGKRNSCVKCGAQSKNPKFCTQTCQRAYNTKIALDKPYIARNGDVLDVTRREVLEYRQSHNECEICYRSGDEVVLVTDHDHVTKKFRGLLCFVCNRQLGWFENNQAGINNYTGS